MSRKRIYTDVKERWKTNSEKYRKAHPQMCRASRLLSGYKREDKKHNRGEGDLTAEWILENIMSQPCAHCGKTGWDIIGCNRLDNSKPHTMDNVEPCCAECNNKLNGENFSKSVYQYTLDGILVAIWKSASEAARRLGFNRSAISFCCNGNIKSAYGYIWSYDEK